MLQLYMAPKSLHAEHLLTLTHTVAVEARSEEYGKNYTYTCEATWKHGNMDMDMGVGSHTGKRDAPTAYMHMPKTDHRECASRVGSAREGREPQTLLY